MMQRFCLLPTSLLFAWIGIAGAEEVAADKTTGSPADLRTQAQATLEQYCYACHGYGETSGGVDLEKLLSEADPTKHRQRWVAVWKNLRAHTMPPASDEQPGDGDRLALIKWIEQDVYQLDANDPDPGHVSVRRLNQEEYRYTIQDLLKINFKVSEELLEDDTGYGFDTIGDVLTISPLLLEKYVNAANKITKQIVPAESSTEKKPVGYSQVFKNPPPANPAEFEAYARDTLRNFARRAYRSPVDNATLDQLMQLVSPAADNVAVAERRLIAPLTAILASPRFLFRIENQVPPTESDAKSRSVLIDEFSLASRLSYFLWKSQPDEELLVLAEQNQLRKQLAAQIERMFNDPRIERMLKSFSGQWLQSRDIIGISVDSRRILNPRKVRPREADLIAANRIFSDKLRKSMQQETDTFFRELFRANGNILDLITADYTYLNETLAAFYGIPNVEGNEMRRVTLPPEANRGGILAQGTLLVVTSNPTRTSPVKRGLFVLENILGVSTPPPPPDVPALANAQDLVEGSPRTMRQLMEAHRADTMCASCHVRMDPIGLAFEHYNAIGQWRETDAGEKIDSAGVLVTGEKISSPRDLAQVIATRYRSEFYHCLTEKMLIFALGRGLDYYDAPTVDQITKVLEQDHGKMQALVREVVLSTPFQKRRKS